VEGLIHCLIFYHILDIYLWIIKPDVTDMKVLHNRVKYVVQQ